MAEKKKEMKVSEKEFLKEWLKPKKRKSITTGKIIGRIKYYWDEKL